MTDGRRGVEEAARPRRPSQGPLGAGSGLHRPRRLGCAQSRQGYQAHSLPGLPAGQVDRGLGLPQSGGAAETRCGLSPLPAQGFAAGASVPGDGSWVGKAAFHACEQSVAAGEGNRFLLSKISAKPVRLES